MEKENQEILLRKDDIFRNETPISYSEVLELKRLKQHIQRSNSLPNKSKPRPKPQRKQSTTSSQKTTQYPYPPNKVAIQKNVHSIPKTTQQKTCLPAVTEATNPNRYSNSIIPAYSPLTAPGAKLQNEYQFLTVQMAMQQNSPSLTFVGAPSNLPFDMIYPYSTLNVLCDSINNMQLYDELMSFISHPNDLVEDNGTPQTTNLPWFYKPGLNNNDERASI
ncbi:hypothetical protein F8M41_020158 [Gigaspora margarita]|uniref:Uncharacterized protein n=1 Tax=Gigaspora margarita TaxID=4874 RepID=A0A8H4AIT1_GIGMA|nr:hypothetical protein F8M41_020158 [Gigaspora margarita]